MTKKNICKLYEVPRASVIRVIGDDKAEPRVPVASLPIKKNDYLVFSHIDGMYSLCYTAEGEIAHLAAWEVVEIISDFEIIRKFIKRGGRGKNGDQPLTWVPICEMSDEWIAAVIEYNKEHGMGDSTFSKYMHMELEYRKKNDISIVDGVKNMFDKLKAQIK